MTSHIPDKGQVMVRYYGLYANAHRGKMRKKDADPLCPLIIKDEDPFIPSKGWAEMIKRLSSLWRLRNYQSIRDILIPLFRDKGDLCSF
ncbi:MAG: hypothetical protein ACOC6P_04020 [Candidatus Aminicenantaceae bacterium]